MNKNQEKNFETVLWLAKKNYFFIFSKLVIPTENREIRVPQTFPSPLKVIICESILLQNINLTPLRRDTGWVGHRMCLFQKQI